MKQTFSANQLGSWVWNFTSNPELPFVTTSALIELKELEAFVKAIKKQQADCVRVYFLRFGLDDVPTPKVKRKGKLLAGCKWNNASPALTQATVALVPAKKFRRDKEFIFSADDISINNQVLALLPGTVGEGTGLNPPAGKGVSFDAK